MPERASKLLTVEEAGRALGVSRATVWRLIRRGALTTVRQGGRRLVPGESLIKPTVTRHAHDVPAFERSHPVFRLVGAGRSGGRAPGARDKHAILDGK